jgi:hypothetical protein
MAIISSELAKRGLAFLDLEKSGDLMQKLSRDFDLMYVSAAVSLPPKAVVEMSNLSDGQIFAIHQDSIGDFLAALSQHKGYIKAPVSSVMRKWRK